MNLSKASLKWYVILAITILLFSFFTPIIWFHSFKFIVFIEGVTCGFFIFMGLMGLDSVFELLHLNTEDSQLNKTSMMVIPFIGAITLSVVFWFATDKRIDNLIKSEGITTNAVIKDGFSSSRTVRRVKTKTNILELEFQKADGTMVHVASDVTDEIFKNVGRNQVVEIKYLPSNPQIFKIMVGNSNVKTFLGIPNRNLKFSDLDKIISLNMDSTKSYLDKISAKWVLKQDQDKSMLINQNKKEVVVKGSNGNLLYKGPDVFLIDSFLKEAEVIDKRIDEKIDNKNQSQKVRIFITPKYEIEYYLDLDVSKIDSYIIIKPKS